MISVCLQLSYSLPLLSLSQKRVLTPLDVSSQARTESYDAIESIYLFCFIPFGYGVSSFEEWDDGTGFVDWPANSDTSMLTS